jgi:hypothetical protein
VICGLFVVDGQTFMQCRTWVFTTAQRMVERVAIPMILSGKYVLPRQCKLTKSASNFTMRCGVGWWATNEVVVEQTSVGTMFKAFI